MRPLFIVRTVATLALAWAAAAACVALHTPLPWMIGPLLATSVVSMAGGPTESWGPLRNAGQWTIGAALGLYFTPQVVALIGAVLAYWGTVLFVDGVHIPTAGAPLPDSIEYLPLAISGALMVLFALAQMLSPDATAAEGH